MSDVALHLGDCLQYMKEISDKSVDAIITDLPYGTTACAWDAVIPLEPMWKEAERVLRANGTFVTTASQPFTSVLVMSNPSLFKYEWIWRKTMSNGFVHAKNKPLKKHENVVVFSLGTTVHKSQSKNRMTYNPQMGTGKPYYKKMTNSYSKILHFPSKANVGFTSGTECRNDGTRYPTSVLDFPNGNNKIVHSTQKPVTLYEYLVKTYTNEDDTVLDICMGSGTTGVACMKTNRNFIGIEKEPKYFEIAKQRIEEARLEFA